jgi:GTP cyclohydrolase II
MKEAGSGVVVYLRQEGRGIGLGEKLKYVVCHLIKNMDKQLWRREGGLAHVTHLFS